MRPELMYGSKAMSLNKAEINRIRVTEMKMLRWISGVTRFDRAPTGRIEATVAVANLKEKIQESHRRWYGHVIRREGSYVRKQMIILEFEWKNRGRPRRR